jgi:hypothetical protein
VSGSNIVNSRFFSYWRDSETMGNGQDEGAVTWSLSNGCQRTTSSFTVLALNPQTVYRLAVGQNCNNA